jgi:hypothetical protein
MAALGLVSLFLLLAGAACSSSSTKASTSSGPDTATASDTAAASDSAVATDDTSSTDDTAIAPVDSAFTDDTTSSSSTEPTTTEPPTATGLCKLLPPDKAATVLADLPGSGPLTQERDYDKACNYEKDDGDTSVHIEELDVNKAYDGAEDYRSSHTGKLIFETVTDIPGVDQAYWNKSDSTLSILKGTRIINVQVKLDDQSNDFDPNSDKAAEKALATKAMLEVAPNVT